MGSFLASSYQERNIGKIFPLRLLKNLVDLIKANTIGELICSSRWLLEVEGTADFDIFIPVVVLSVRAAAEG